MAKSSSFFGLRSGSTKSLTFQTLHGQQITKDRVTKVTNPQSSKQMGQRLLVPMVASARSMLKGLVNHSWEGIDYGYKSLQEFSRRNLQSGVLSQIKMYVPKGMADCGLANYIVSAGSLPSFGITMRGSSAAGGFVTAVINAPLVEIAQFGNTADDALGNFNSLLSMLPNVQVGDQITILGLFGLNGSQFIYESGGVARTAQRHMFCVSRFVVPEVAGAEDNEGWLGVANDDELPTSCSVQNDYFLCTFTNGTLTISGAEGSTGGRVLQGVAVILSRKVDNVWKRSFSRIELYNEQADGTTYDVAEPTYVKSGSSSDRYLNEGTDSTGITGGVVVTPVTPE